MKYLPHDYQTYATEHILNHPEYEVFRRYIMNAFEFLSRAYRLDQQVQSKTQQISDLRAMASHVSAFLGNEPVSHTRDVTSMQGTVAKIIEEEARLNQEIDQLVDAKQEISEVISQVQDVNLRLILEKRYLLFEYWEKIAVDLGYTTRWVKERHKMALWVVDRILERDFGS